METSYDSTGDVLPMGVTTAAGAMAMSASSDSYAEERREDDRGATGTELMETGPASWVNNEEALTEPTLAPAHAPLVYPQLSAPLACLRMQVDTYVLQAKELGELLGTHSTQLAMLSSDATASSSARYDEALPSMLASRMSPGLSRPSHQIVDDVELILLSLLDADGRIR
jgi:hypothetical protein